MLQQDLHPLGAGRHLSDLDRLDPDRRGVTIRLQDSDGFTQPIDTSTGNLVQWLNLALVGINHDIQE